MPLPSAEAVRRKMAALCPAAGFTNQSGERMWFTLDGLPSQPGVYLSGIQSGWGPQCSCAWLFCGACSLRPPSHPGFDLRHSVHRAPPGVECDYRVSITASAGRVNSCMQYTSWQRGGCAQRVAVLVGRRRLTSMHGAFVEAPLIRFQRIDGPTAAAEL